ncbi:Hypothetical predicted protein [Pelobates cultripes]|uniref:Uncharacterized protein n=1 Tax=Pelobates cultripes TaxID=61616 RepID=A0AAD1SEQ1_PELCU|nr:Hypothetical predicted protein [Pelobates cultripes]
MMRTQGLRDFIAKAPEPQNGGRPRPDILSPQLSLTSEGQGSSHHQDDGEDLAPAQKWDIKQLIREMKQMFDADMNLARTEIQAVSQRVQASEEDIIDIRQELKTVGDTIRQLQSSDSAFQLRLDTMEDQNWQMNIKIWGILDSAGPAELSHYLRRLTATLLPHTQAKKLEFDGHVRINKAKQALPEAPQDLIVRCHSILDKRRFLTAVRNKTPLDFESSRLTFFQDITRTTLQ